MPAVDLQLATAAGPVLVAVEALADAPRARVPTLATPGSACYDLYAAEACELRRGEVTLVRTGFKMRPPPGYFLEVRPRSGLSTKGVLMVNAPGTIDRDYSSEVRVPLSLLFGERYAVSPGDRIAQIRAVAQPPQEFRPGPVPPVEGRTGGFGSTGV